MNNIIKFLNNLFHVKPKYPIGALKSPIDYRNIQLSSFQKPITLPTYYETDMPEVEYQNGNICVAEAIHKVKEVYLTQANKYIDLSPEDLYEQCKLIDGIPDLQGTYLTVGAKVACSTGIASTMAYNSHQVDAIAKSRDENRLGGYAFVASDYESVCQAIYQNKAIVASFDIDSNWYIGIITKLLKSIGRHAVVLHGFRAEVKTVIGQNSWGINWIGKVAGIINPSIKPGHFEMLWSEYENDASDLISFIDIPEDIMQKVKNLSYQFLNDINPRENGYQVMKLQDRLKSENCFSKNITSTGFYGSITTLAVKKYQIIKNIQSTGIVGPVTRAVLNNSSYIPSQPLDVLLNAIIQIESGGDDNAEGDKTLTNHAYGCLQIRQGVCDQVNAKFGTHYKSQDCLGHREISVDIWNKYWQIFTDMVTDQDKAFSWNGGVGWRKLYKTAGYEKYTLELDNYWIKVQKYL